MLAHVGRLDEFKVGWKTLYVEDIHNVFEIEVDLNFDLLHLFMFDFLDVVSKLDKLRSSQHVFANQLYVGVDPPQNVLVFSFDSLFCCFKQNFLDVP